MEMARTQKETSLVKLRHFYTRVSRLWNGSVKKHCKSFAFQSLNVFFAIGSLLSFFVAVALVYSYVFPTDPGALVNGNEVTKQSGMIPDEKCDFFEGNWIEDESYPLYNSSLCPFAERGFDCLARGRRDSGYMKWRWKPRGCEVPRFNAREALEKLRGKRVVFVGDSLSRTQWESLICMLMEGVEDKRSVYEINGNQVTKEIRFLGIFFSTYGLRMDFYRSVFLVQASSAPRRSPKRIKSALRLDVMDDIHKEWVDSDVLVFNTGHWWNPTKLFEMGCYFQEDKSLKLGMPINSAFRKALDTWASWVETTVNTNRTRVFFRTFESSHWGVRPHSSCKVTRRPLTNTRGREHSVISDNIIEAVKKMTVPATVLHVTKMGAFRSDGHVGAWSDNPSVPDCSHWCLPGVPDMWNEILLSSL